MSAPPPAPAPSGATPPAAPTKHRLHCINCNTLCEVQLPVLNNKKSVRFQIKCPKCETVNELRIQPGGDPSAAGGASAPKVGAPATKPASSAPPTKPKPQTPPQPSGPPPSVPKAPVPPSAGTASNAAGQKRKGAADAAADPPKKVAGRPKGSGGKAAAAAKPAAAANGGAARGRGAASSTSTDMLDDFIIEEASERLPAASAGNRGRRNPAAPSARRKSVGAKPISYWAPSAFEKTFPLTPIAAPASCEVAFEQATFKPRWKVNDDAEVAFKGKGFEGSWSAATVVLLDDRNHVLVRYNDFVDDDGTPLVERMPIERLRLPPPPAPSDWVPQLGEQVEGLWNDCWWEGTAREFHHTKGILFQYDRWHSNWLWLPLRCARPRPPFWLYYPLPKEGEEEEEEEEEEREGRPPAGVCGRDGCMLPNNHKGLCQVSTEGASRRAVVKQRTDLQAQLQRYQEIQLSKESRDHVAIARADALKKAEDEGVTIKAPRGNRSQWHSNFRLDEFGRSTRDLPVVQRADGDGDGGLVLRGLLVVGPGHTVADCCKMLLTELQLGPSEGWWQLSAVGKDGTTLVSYEETPPSEEFLPLLPPTPCYLLVGNCAPPRCVQVDAPAQKVIFARD